MQPLEEYINVGTKRMRCGYTTGTCAAAASRAAAELLLRGELVPAVTVSTPAGIDVVVEVEEHEAGDGWAQCAVQKDSGDDPDVTNGALVYARVERCEEPGGHVDGGDVREVHGSIHEAASFCRLVLQGQFGRPNNIMECLLKSNREMQKNTVYISPLLDLSC